MVEAFALLRGLPVERMTRFQAAVAFWGIGQHIGKPVSQNNKGHLLGHVKDLGGDYNKVRGYMTRAHMGFHCDRADMLSLCCLHPAKSGGEHRICSSVTLYNEMLKRDPNLVHALFERFYRARAGEIPPGETEPWTRQPVFSITDGYFAARGANAAIRKAQGMPGVPKLTDVQVAAIDMYKKVADEIAFLIKFEIGDISYVSNHTVLHSRTAFEDFPEPERKRHLLRMWISTGTRPMHPDIERDFHGVIIPGLKLTAPLDVS